MDEAAFDTLISQAREQAKRNYRSIVEGILRNPSGNGVEIILDALQEYASDLEKKGQAQLGPIDYDRGSHGERLPVYNLKQETLLGYLSDLADVPRLLQVLARGFRIVEELEGDE